MFSICLNRPNLTGITVYFRVLFYVPVFTFMFTTHAIELEQ